MPRRDLIDPNDPVLRRPFPHFVCGGPVAGQTYALIRNIPVRENNELDLGADSVADDFVALMEEMRDVIRSPWCREDPQLRLLACDGEIVQELKKSKGRIETVPECIIGADNLWRLDPCEPLNDEVVNIYMHMMRARAVRQAERVQLYGTDHEWPNVHFMISGFWVQAQKGWAAGRLERLMRKQKVDIFEKELFMFPAFELDMHWRACAVDMKQRVIKVYDANGWTIGLTKFFGYIEDFLLHEEGRSDRKTRQGTTSAVQGGEAEQDGDEEVAAKQPWGREIVVGPGSPHQTAAYDSADDCGVFALQWLDAVARGREFKVVQKNMVAIRKIMALEIALGRLLPRE